GRELWHYESSGAVAGLVKDIVPGEEGSNPTALTDFDGTLLFYASNDGTRTTVWMSDGTAGGTVPFVHPDERATPQLGPSVRPLSMDGTLYYVGQGSIWRGDLTPSGTELVAGPFGGNPTFLARLGDDLVYVA